MIPRKSEIGCGLEDLARRSPSGRAVRGTETEKARALQQSILPRVAPTIDGYSIAFAWEPSEDASCDYFNVFALDDRRSVLCIADVSGKGLPAATLMQELDTAVRAAAPKAATPADLCTRVNQALCARIAPGGFITMFYGILDCETGVLAYESAGHCLPLLMRADGAVEFPASFSGVMGIFSHWLYRDQELVLASGDTLLLLTKGVIDVEGRNREVFGYQRLIAAVQQGRGAGAHPLGRHILEALDKFSTGRRRDEASLLIVQAG